MFDNLQFTMYIIDRETFLHNLHLQRGVWKECSVCTFFLILRKNRKNKCAYMHLLTTRSIKSILIPLFELLKCFASLLYKQCTVQTRASGISSNLRSAGLPNWTGSTLSKGTNNKRGRPNFHCHGSTSSSLCTFSHSMPSFMLFSFSSRKLSWSHSLFFCTIAVMCRRGKGIFWHNSW